MSKLRLVHITLGSHGQREPDAVSNIVVGLALAFNRCARKQVSRRPPVLDGFRTREPPVSPPVRVMAELPVGAEHSRIRLQRSARTRGVGCVHPVATRQPAVAPRSADAVSIGRVVGRSACLSRCRFRLHSDPVLSVRTCCHGAFSRSGRSFLLTRFEAAWRER